MKDIQNKIDMFCKENKMESPGEYRLLDLYSEMGEVAKEILKTTNYGRNKYKPNDKIKDELGDVFYSLITVANSYDVDLEEELNKTLNKYNKRIKKGSAGSENE